MLKHFLVNDGMKNQLFLFFNDPGMHRSSGIMGGEVYILAFCTNGGY